MLNFLMAVYGENINLLLKIVGSVGAETTLGNQCSFISPDIYLWGTPTAVAVVQPTI